MKRIQEISYENFDKVLFLDKQQYHWTHVDIKDVTLHESPYEKWYLYNAPQVRSKNRINLAEISQRIAYQRIQQDFINGIYYDLKDCPNYGRVLMYDLRDAFHIGKDDLEDYLNKLDVLICCMFGKDLSSFMRNRVYNRITTIFDLLDQCLAVNDLLSVKSVATHFEDLPLTWAEYATAYMKATQEDIDVLRSLGRYREGGFDNVWFNSIAGRVDGRGRYLRERVIKLFMEVARKTKGFERYVQLAKEDKKYIKDDTCIFLLYQCASYVIQKYDVFDEGLMPYHKYEGKDQVVISFEKALESIELKYDKEIARVINDLYGKSYLYSAVKTIKDDFVRNENVTRFVVIFDYIVDYFINRANRIKEICLDAVRLIAKCDRFDALRYYFLSCVLYDKLNVPLAKSVVDILFPTIHHKEKFSHLFEKNRNCNDYCLLWDALKGFYNEFDKWRGPTGLLSEDFLLKMARIEKFDEGQFEIRTVDSYCVPERKVVLIDKSEVEIRKERFEKTASDLSELLDEGDYQDEALRLVGKPERIFDRVVADLISLFKRENFILSSVQLNDFSVDKGLMTNSIVNQINETYFEILDDNLIEETEDGWVMNKDYYEQIKTEIQ